MDKKHIMQMAKEDVILELENRGITMHPNTGVNKLRSILIKAVEGTYEGTVEKPDTKKVPVNVKKVARKVMPRLSKEERAMRLVRIVVTPNDPLLASYPGLIFTVGSSAINNGRMIKKFVPFNNDEGWHVPHIIYEQIKNAEMQKFKQVKAPNGQKVMVPYITKKFNVEVLPDLTKEELDALAAAQKSRGDA